MWRCTVWTCTASPIRSSLWATGSAKTPPGWPAPPRWASWDGYLWYEGRADDVFKSAGYRIGPGEIENCLVKHAAVANAAVVPKPDTERGALVKAYVVLSPDYAARRPQAAQARQAFEAELVAQLQAHVRGLLAPYEYPKEVEFIEQLPMTTTGKVQRWRTAASKM